MENLIPKKPLIDLFYFTDPLCSHCWALDTILTRFKLEYSEYLNVHTVMGAMVEDDYHYTDLKGPEAKELVSHWDQVARFYHIPMNGNIWHKDPITSSFPSSIAFLYLTTHSPEKAGKFMRLVREGAFLFEKNIAKRDVLEAMLKKLEIDPVPVLDFSFSEAGKQLLMQNLHPMQDLSVNGFPTVVMVNQNHEGVKVVGSRTMEVYKKALHKVLPDPTELNPHPLPGLSQMLDIFPTLFYSDLEKLYDLAPERVKSFVQESMKDVPYRLGEVSGYRYLQKNIHDEKR
jgi:predicted DsbA family dithiol-disulfide isomerase